MTTLFRMGSSPVLAMVAAGPVYVASVALTAYFAAIPHPQPLNMSADTALTMAFAAIPVTLFGIALSFLPCLLGSLMLGHLGRWLPVMRQPLVWGLTGAALPGGVFLGLILEAIENQADDLYWLIGLIVTGAICALICRRGARWQVPALPAVPLAQAV